MGVLNVTPDSFSDGGTWASADAAIGHALDLQAQGADVIDVGGESTRPGAARVSPADEQARVIPVIAELARQGLVVSVDTLNSETAHAAAAAGATIINDVSGGLADPAMASVAAQTGLTYVAMHWRAHAQQMDGLASYDNVVTDVRTELAARVAELTQAGVALENIVLDPGLGFSKLPEHNWQILANLAAFDELGLPVMIGASRKRFLAGSLPAAWAVRVHDVAATRTALNVLALVRSGRMDV
jgi:dihydropteroate synthase